MRDRLDGTDFDECLAITTAAHQELKEVFRSEELRVEAAIDIYNRMHEQLSRYRAPPRISGPVDIVIQMLGGGTPEEITLAKMFLFPQEELLERVNKKEWDALAKVLHRRDDG